MKATTTRLSTWIIAVLGLSASLAGAGETTTLIGTSAAVGQLGGGNSDAKRQSDAYLAEARQLMARGQLDAAADRLRRADELKVSYLFYPGDTPAKVRSDLEKMLQAAPRRTVTSGTRTPYLPSLPPQNAPSGANQPGPNSTTPPDRFHSADRARPLGAGASRFANTDGPIPQAPAQQAEPVGVDGRDRWGNVVAPPRSTTADSPVARNNAAVKAHVQQLVDQARRALSRGDLVMAEKLAEEAQRSGIPDSAFAPNEDRPSFVLAEVRKARGKSTSQVRHAGGDLAGGDSPYPATRAVYNPASDPTRNLRASADEPARLPSPQPMAVDVSGMSAQQMYDEGLKALQAGDGRAARQFFLEAWRRGDQLDDQTRSRVQDHLQLLSRPQSSPDSGRPASLLELADEKQKLTFNRLAAEISRAQADAVQMQQRDPRRALAMLRDVRSMVERSELDKPAQDYLLRRVDFAIADMEKFIAGNRSDIELREQNDAVRDQIKREEEHKLHVQQETARMVEEFNKLVDEQRFAEAELVAKRVYALDPNSVIARQVRITANMLRRYNLAKDLQRDSEDGFVYTMDAAISSAIPFDDNNPYRLPEPTVWDDLTRRRRGQEVKGRRRTEKELQIERSLGTPVSLKFTRTPLGEVLDHLASVANINVYIDPQGLDQEGVSIDTPVSISLRDDISLKSALTLILQPLHLHYVVKNEVLKITSETMRSSEVYTVTYDVADLVVPIPNFVPAGLGIESALNNAYSGLASTTLAGSQPTMTTLAGPNGGGGVGQINPAVLAQMQGAGVPLGGGFGMGGPGGAGGGAKPDFDALIDLIQSTVEPTTWTEVGGSGSVAGYDTNLSLVISQTQEVHEQIVDLLEQLRRLQDLQVTIEVRFITLQDNFFERIGIDFDFSVPTVDQIPLDNTPTVIGIDVTGQPTPNLDIDFRQGSFAAALPQFGGFDATSAASFGFAILSEIEAFFFVEAAQGDDRTNIMQAPKVTLFNGQQAFVSDTTQMPFVISLIPVVGDFAAAQQPVVVVLSEGTFMTVQAVVSPDRRYVRLTIVPFFSKIGDVEEFTFQGSTTTRRSSSEAMAGDDEEASDSEETITEGTTVQLPSFSFVTVTTTVSVPDGGTVLLGGIKRLSEGRNEEGVPMLDKIPYINRLFKNVGIGRTTQSLMMMVTPRIIIQEEEEERLGIAGGP